MCYTEGNDNMKRYVKCN